MRLTTLTVARHLLELHTRPDVAQARAMQTWLETRREAGHDTPPDRRALAVVKWCGRAVRRTRWHVPEDNTEH